MKQWDIVCIVCPRGCRLKVTEENETMSEFLVSSPSSKSRTLFLVHSDHRILESSLIPSQVEHLTLHSQCLACIM